LLYRGRIVASNKEFGYVDGDIAFTFKVEKDQKRGCPIEGKTHRLPLKIRITTFYGRVQLKPCLRDLEYLRTHYRREKIDLKVCDSEEVPTYIRDQPFPAFPKTLEFSGTKNRYTLEIFNTDQGKKTFLTTEEYDRHVTKEVHETTHISSSVKRGIQAIKIA
jgi:hypothetical protein